jgi:regulator of cell morphogenesis and NO signaling
MLAETASLLAMAPPGEEGLGPLREAFTTLCDTLQPHMIAEEHTLFPVVQHLEDCWRRNEPLTMNFVGGVGKPVGHLIAEHVTIIEKLRQLLDAKSRVADDDGECTRVLNAIDDLAHELREHIHLENNVLYPRATALEAAVVR